MTLEINWINIHVLIYHINKPDCESTMLVHKICQILVEITTYPISCNIQVRILVRIDPLKKSLE